ncbi:hypothetical protein PMAYCL1PPCAC_02908 [Pristionchus mayeri]|uniref:Tmbi-4 n=1 Tax=Pristionchus mayeri TaxID=1317129 RepID=A0AAN4Z688_9BILA|nr:hypothetical protein PMAYCL1PPCAC_02908 [Pristionchus mayeri]
MGKQEFEVLDYFGPVVVGALFAIALILISFFIINFFCITKYDDFTVFEKAGARFNKKLGPHSLRLVKKVVYDEDDISLYSDASSLAKFTGMTTLLGSKTRADDVERLLESEEGLLEENSSSPPSTTQKNNRRHLWPKDQVARAVGAKMGSVGAAQLSIRMAFLRKVFGILTAQVLITAGICGAIYAAPHSAQFVAQNSWLLLISLFSSMGLIIGLHLHARSVPLNYILLCAFTVSQALTLGVVVSLYNLRSVVEAACLTFVVVLGLFLYTLQSKRDFRKGHAIAFSLLSLLLMTSIIQIIFQSPAFHFFVNLGGAALFCFFIIIDLDMIMKDMEAEDYILACVTLYLDVINLFMYILQIVGEANRQ